MALDYSAVRRRFHQIPELGFQEVKTQKLLLEYIRSFPQEHLTINTWRTGILVKVQGTDPTQTIGYRTDIDGLPIQEATGFPFTSIHDGYMHACGHDFHMTIALGVLERLANKPVKDNVVIIFQPAEEGPGGALPLMESETFQAFRPDQIFALHIAPELPVGTIGTKKGLLFANTSELFIDLLGKGGHAAYPHLTHDMVVAACALVTQLQTIVARNVNPIDAAVITVGKITAGTKQNIIAETARIEGTIRARHPETMARLKQRIEDHVKAIEMAYQSQASIDFGANYYQVYNHPEITERFMALCEAQTGVNLIVSDEAMTGEDFGYFLRDIKGFMFWLGVGSDSGLHSATLTPNEQALQIGVDVVSRFIDEGFSC